MKKLITVTNTDIEVRESNIMTITIGDITFEKDDDNIIHFISSFANLRMLCFSIQMQSFN